MDALHKALRNSYWNSRANTGDMAKAALDALGLPRDAEYCLPIERVIDRWITFGPISFGAMAQEVRRVVEDVRRAG